MYVTTDSFTVRSMANGKRRIRRKTDQTKIVLYTRVSTDEQAD